jgi:sugar O-acyltransferase (sialic acid O-acetyltransferase NeuD family)
MSDLSGIVVYGAGGHGRVVAEAAVAAGLAVAGFLDDGVPVGTVCDGLPVLGGLEWLSPATQVRVALGIGDNRTRERVAARLSERSVALLTVVHPSARVSPHAVLGEGSVVLPLAAVNSGARLGIGCIANTAAVIEHDSEVGDFAHVAPNATLCGGARVGRLALVGAASCILIARSLGDRSVLGAGAVLTEDVPDDVVAVGVPARVLRPVARDPER